MGVSLLTKEQLPKRIDNSFYVPDAERQNCAQSHRCQSKLRLVEKYIDGSVHIHAHFVLSFKLDSGEIDTAQLCAVFHRHPDIGPNGWLGNRAVFRSDRHVPDCVSLFHDHQHAVFVDVVELGDDEQNAGFDGEVSYLRSIVRLHSLQSCQSLFRDAPLELSHRTSEGRTVKTDGEKCDLIGFSHRSSVDEKPTAIPDGRAHI